MVVPPSSIASISPGITPAMNRSPMDADMTSSPFGPFTTMPEVATEYITITMEGGIRMPNPPAEVTVPTPNCGG